MLPHNATICYKTKDVSHDDIYVIDNSEFQTIDAIVLENPSN